MTSHNTREGIEEWRNTHDFKQAVYAADKFLDEPYADPDGDAQTVSRQFNRMVERYDALKETLHLELQKAREEERERIWREYEQFNTFEYVDEKHAEVAYEAIGMFIDIVYQSELDQPITSE